MFGPDGKMGLKRSMRISCRGEKGVERGKEVLMASVLVHSVVH